MGTPGTDGADAEPPIDNVQTFPSNWVPVLAFGPKPALTTGAIRLSNGLAAGLYASKAAGGDRHLISFSSADSVTLDNDATGIMFGGTFSPVNVGTQDIGASNRPLKSIFFGGAAGQYLQFGLLLTELTTINAAAFTDTTIQMPAGAVILGVTVRTTVVIPTATSYDVGDAAVANRFNTALVGVAAGSIDSGTKAGAYYNAAAASIRLTMNGGVPAANTGRVRVTIFYYTISPPTS